jgi:hypothetical protein
MGELSDHLPKLLMTLMIGGIPKQLTTKEGMSSIIILMHCTIENLRYYKNGRNLK